MERTPFGRKAFAASATILFLLTLAPPAAAGPYPWIADPILAQQIPIDVIHPIAGSNYYIRTQCANQADTAQCVHINTNGWVRYQFTIDGFGSNGVDLLTRYIRGQSWAQNCDWRLQGPGIDETRPGCPGSPNAPEESGGMFWFFSGYPQGTYTITLTCNGSCNYIWIASLELRTYYHEFRLYVYEHDREYFPEPGRIGLPNVDPQADACLTLKFDGSHWYRDITYTLDWGDGSSITDVATLEGGGEHWRPSWARSFCHAYEFPFSTYQICASGDDGLHEPVSACVTISGGMNVEEFANQGIAYVTGTVT